MNDHMSELCIASFTSAHSPYLVSVAASMARYAAVLDSTSAAEWDGLVLITTGPWPSPTARNGEAAGKAVVLPGVTAEPWTSRRVVVRRPAPTPETPVLSADTVPALPCVKLGKMTRANSDWSTHGV